MTELNDTPTKLNNKVYAFPVHLTWSLFSLFVTDATSYCYFQNKFDVKTDLRFVKKIQYLQVMVSNSILSMIHNQPNL